MTATTTCDRPTACPPPTDLAAIAGADLAGLRAIWRKHFKEPPPLRSLDFMRHLLAWRLQAKSEGGIDRHTRLKLKRMKTMANEGLDLGIGAKIIREWQGQIYEIVVEENGFRWEDTLYPSLSAVAMAITGTRWNGPRFFGLRAGKP